MTRRCRRALCALCCLGLATAAAAAEPGRAVVIQARPVPFDATAPDAERFGALDWRGGIELLSDDGDFGGYSGIVVSADGTRLLAASDRGMWLTASLVYEAGRLVGIEAARTAPVLSAQGLPLEPKSFQDAEGLAPFAGEGPDGPVLLALEREERILAFEFGRDGFAALPELIRLPDEAALGPNNKELEAVGRFWGAMALSGTIIAVSERLLDDAGNVVGWLIGTQTNGSISVRRSEDFDVTDLAVLPDGDVLILERKLSPLLFTSMRIRRIAAADIAPGAVLDGPVLIQAQQPRSAIDNMEALAVHRTIEAELRITLMSDDNFNPLQRTLVMQFALRGGE